MADDEIRIDITSDASVIGREISKAIKSLRDFAKQLGYTKEAAKNIVDNAPLTAWSKQLGDLALKQRLTMKQLQAEATRLAQQYAKDAAALNPSFLNPQYQGSTLGKGTFGTKANPVVTGEGYGRTESYIDPEIAAAHKKQKEEAEAAAEAERQLDAQQRQNLKETIARNKAAADAAKESGETRKKTAKDVAKTEEQAADTTTKANQKAANSHLSVGSATSRSAREQTQSARATVSAAELQMRSMDAVGRASTMLANTIKTTGRLTKQDVQQIAGATNLRQSDVIKLAADMGVARKNIEGLKSAQRQATEEAIKNSKAQVQIGQAIVGSTQTQAKAQKDLSAAIKGTGEETKKSGSNVLSFWDKAKNLAQRASIVAAGYYAALGLRSIASGFSQAIAAGFEFNATIEQTDIAFTSMLGSAQLSQDLIANLVAMAAKTPFLFPQLTVATQRLMAYGFNLNELLPTLKAVGDAVAGLGGSQETVDRVIVALGQMRAKTKVMAQEMRQMAEAGIPVWDILAKGLGKTAAEVMKLTENSMIPASQAIDIILKGMEERFPNMMEKQSKSFKGLASTMKDFFLITMGDITKPAFDKAKEWMSKLALEILPSFSLDIERFGLFDAIEKRSPVLTDILKSFGIAFQGIGQAISAILPMVNSFIQSLGVTVISSFNAALVVLGNGLKAIATVISAIPPQILTFLGTIGGMVVGIKLVNGAVGSLISLGASIGKRFVLPAIASLSQFIGFTKVAATSFKTLVSTQGLAGGIKGFFAGFGEAPAFLSKTAGAALGLTGVTGGLVAGLAALAGVMYLAKKHNDDLKTSMTNTMEAAENLAKSTGIEWDISGKKVDDATESVDKFREENQKTIDVIKNFGDLDLQRAYVVEVGFNMAMAGGDPKAINEQVAKLFELGTGTKATFDIDFTDFMGRIRNVNTLIDGMFSQLKDNMGSVFLTPQLQDQIDGITQSLGAMFDQQRYPEFLAALSNIDTYVKSIDTTTDKSQSRAFLDYLYESLSRVAGVKLDANEWNNFDSILSALGTQTAPGISKVFTDVQQVFLNTLINTGNLNAALQAGLDLMFKLAGGTSEAKAEMTDFTYMTVEGAIALKEHEKVLENWGKWLGDAVDSQKLWDDMMKESEQSAKDVAKESAKAAEGTTKNWRKYLEEAEVDIEAFWEELRISIEEQKVLESQLLSLGSTFGTTWPAMLTQMFDAETLKKLVPELLSMPYEEALEKLKLLWEDFKRGQDQFIVDYSDLHDRVAAITSKDSGDWYKGLRESLGLYSNDLALLAQTMELSTDQMFKILPDLAKTGTAEFWQAIVGELQNGSSEVAAIVLSYGQALANGLNVVLLSVDGKLIQVPTEMAFHHKKEGGFLPDQATIQQPKANLVQWAEPETEGEAFIPMAQNKRPRSIEIWKEVGKRFGLLKFAEGGFRREEDVPYPPASPHSMYGTADLAMEHAYTAVVQWVKDHVGKRFDIVEFAKSFVGKVPYVFGGTTTSGWDCSGFVQYVLGHYGIGIPRIAADQQQVGRSVTASSALPADLVFYGYPAHHVSMYTGNGESVEARGVAYGTTTASAFRSGYSNVKDVVSVFDQGGILNPGYTLAYNGTGHGETVLPEPWTTIGANQAGWMDEMLGYLQEMVEGIKAQVNADEEIEEGTKGAEANKRIIDAFEEENSILDSYVKREQSRLEMLKSMRADNSMQLATLAAEIDVLDQQVALKQIELETVKSRGMDPETINEITAELFDLQSAAAEAKDELEALARVPLEDAVARWSNAAGQLQTLFDLLGNASNGFASQLAMLPGLLGNMGAQFQAYVDMMNMSTNPEDIMNYGTQAINQLQNMYQAEAGVLETALQDTLDDIGKQEEAANKHFDELLKQREAQWKTERDKLQTQLDAKRNALEKSRKDAQDIAEKELKDLEEKYDKQLRAMDDKEREITRAEQMNRMRRSLSSSQDEYRILQGQGFYTEADISRMKELESQIQDQKDEIQQQTAAWEREDARLTLEREKEFQVNQLKQRQEHDQALLEEQIRQQEEALEAQQKALDQRIENERAAIEAERAAAQKRFDDLRQQANDEYQKQINLLVEKYAQMMQEVINQQNALLGEQQGYNNSGYALGVAFADGIRAAIPLIQQAGIDAATALADVLQLNSPAKEGPLSSLDTWWDKFMPTVSKPLVDASSGQGFSPVMDIARKLERVFTGIEGGSGRTDTVHIIIEGEIKGQADSAAIIRELEKVVTRKVEERRRGSY